MIFLCKICLDGRLYSNASDPTQAEIFTPDDIMHAIRFAPHSGIWLRNKCQMILQYFGAMHIGEAAALNTVDIDVDQDGLKVSLNVQKI